MKFKILILFIVLIQYKTFTQNFWEYIGLEGFFIANIAQDNSGRLYATEWQGSGDSVFFSDDFGKTWDSYGEVNDSEFVNISSILFLDNDDILISGWGGGAIYKSTDGSKTWEQKNTGASINTCTKILKNSDSLFASIYDSIYLSVDEGENWTILVSSPDPDNVIVDIARTKDGKLFAATFSEVFRSTDNGLSWEQVNNGIPPTTDFFMNLTLLDSGYLYLGTRRLGIYRSKDWGNNWEFIRHGWIRYVTTKQGGYVMAGAEQEGLIMSTNYGDTWQIINSGLPNSTFINSVYFDKDGYAYCSVHNFGIFRSILPVSVDDEGDNSNLNSYILYQNYPNPFNPSTIISFSIGENSYVTLKVFDILGREVAVLVDESLNAGNHKIQFDGSNFESGIYFYEITAGNFRDVKKLILLK